MVSRWTSVSVRQSICPSFSRTSVSLSVFYFWMGLGLLMGKFHQILTELSACNTIMAGYYSLMFLFIFFFLVVCLQDLMVSYKLIQFFSCLCYTLADIFQVLSFSFFIIMFLF